MKKTDEYFINEALKIAEKSKNSADVPVGCIIVYNKNKQNIKMCEIADKQNIKDGSIISRAYNMRNKKMDATSHAEIIAISKACKRIKDFRLEECTMYVTLEPCQMCAGAILQSRIKKLVIGAKNFKFGSVGTIINILQNDKFNHKVDVEFMENKECGEILKKFFKEVRNAKR